MDVLALGLVEKLGLLEQLHDPHHGDVVGVRDEVSLVHAGGSQRAQEVLKVHGGDVRPGKHAAPHFDQLLFPREGLRLERIGVSLEILSPGGSLHGRGRGLLRVYRDGSLGLGGRLRHPLVGLEDRVPLAVKHRVAVRQDHHNPPTLENPVLHPVGELQDGLPSDQGELDPALDRDGALRFFGFELGVAGEPLGLLRVGISNWVGFEPFITPKEHVLRLRIHLQSDPLGEGGGQV